MSVWMQMEDKLALPEASHTSLTIMSVTAEGPEVDSSAAMVAKIINKLLL